MKRCRILFNSYLSLALGIFLTGCETTKEGQKTDTASKSAAKPKKEKKELSTVDFYLETSSYANNPNSAPIYRQNPIRISVLPQPFLDLASVDDATIIEDMAGFAIQIRFDSHGAFVLDTTTSANKGKRIAIFSKFPEPRWLAAPQIVQRNPTGLLTFTPDATREEAERLVRGLKTAIAEYKKRNRF